MTYVSDREGEALARAASGSGGPSISGGALVVMAIVAALACGLCGAPLATIGNNQTQANREKARAEAEAAAALRIREESEKIRAEAAAQALKDYSEVSRLALTADVRRSHPELLLQSWLPVLCLIGLAAIALPLTAAMLWAIFNDRAKSALNGGDSK